MSGYSLKAILGFLIAIFLIGIPVVYFNVWMNSTLSTMETSRKSTVAAHAQAPVNPYHSNVQIDPWQDALAPRVKNVPQTLQPKIVAEKDKQPPLPAGILVQ